MKTLTQARHGQCHPASPVTGGPSERRPRLITPDVADKTRLVVRDPVARVRSQEPKLALWFMLVAVSDDKHPGCAVPELAQCL